MIIVRSNLFLSSNANHPIGLPHTPIIRFCPMLVSLSATVVSVLFFCFNFFVFFFFFCFMRFIIHGFMLSVSIQLVRVESIGPRQVNRSFCRRSASRIPLPYCITNFTSRSAFTTPNQCCSGYQCIMRCLPEFNACVRMTKVWR